MQKVIFNFYNIAVAISCSEAEILNKVRKDFCYFLSSETTSKPYLEITAHFQSIDKSFLQTLPKTKSSNCDIYDQGLIRWNDYFGKALVRFDFQNESATIYSENLDALHETIYLITLSRVGKALDLQGLHRLHAMSAVINNVTVTCSMHMGNGKTSFLLESLKNPATTWLSDDSPLISQDGVAHCFPLRIGVTTSWLEKYQQSSSHIDFAQMYEITRMKYGKKHLLPTTAFTNSIIKSSPLPQLILIGKRTSGPCQVSSISALRALPILFLNLAIGLGLPMMREYFFEPGIKRNLNVVSIFFSRMRTVFSLMRQSHFAYIQLSPDPSSNLKVLCTFLENKVPQAASKLLKNPQP